MNNFKFIIEICRFVYADNFIIDRKIIQRKFTSGFLVDFPHFEKHNVSAIWAVLL